MFTYEEFRSTEGFRTPLAKFLNSDVGMLVIRVMRQKYRPYDVPNTSDALTSARILAQYHGAHVALDDLELLATPPINEAQIEATYDSQNTDHVNLPDIDEMLRPQIIVKEE
jgi:hypothetical protein